MVIYIIVIMVIFIILVPVIRIIQPITIITIIIILVIVLVIILILVIVILILNYKIIDNNLEYHHQCMEYLYHLLNLKLIINQIELDLIEDIIHHIKHEHIYIIDNIYIHNRYKQYDIY